LGNHKAILTKIGFRRRSCTEAFLPLRQDFLARFALRIA
jgi:hypothetical protein